MGMGVQLLQMLVVEPLSFSVLIVQPRFYLLILHSLLLLTIGAFVLNWGNRTARQYGYLGHY